MAPVLPPCRARAVLRARVLQSVTFLKYLLLYSHARCVYVRARARARVCVHVWALLRVAAAGQIFCGSTSTLSEKEAALRAAVARHGALLREASAGQGVDRHLYALHALWKQQQEARREKGAALGHEEGGEDDQDEEEPAIFRSAGYATLNRTMLSTSNCGNPALRLFGFGPVVRDGFGIGYIIKDEGITFCAASKCRQTERLLETLSMYLRDVAMMLGDVAAAPQTASPAPATAPSKKTKGRKKEPVVRALGVKKAPLGRELRAAPQREQRERSASAAAFWGVCVDRDRTELRGD